MTQQKQKLPSTINTPATRSNVAAAFNSKERAISVLEDKQKLEEMKLLTLEKAQKNMDMALRIIRKWLESSNT